MDLTKLELSLLSVCFSSFPDPMGTIFSIRFLIARECPFKTERSSFFLGLLWVEISGGTWQVLRRPLQYIPNWSRWWLHILNLLASTRTTSKNLIRKHLLALTKCIIIVIIIIIIIHTIKVESKEFAFYFRYFIFEVVKNNNCDKVPIPFNPAVQIPILRCKISFDYARGHFYILLVFASHLLFFLSKNKGGNIDLIFALQSIKSTSSSISPWDLLSPYVLRWFVTSRLQLPRNNNCSERVCKGDAK